MEEEDLVINKKRKTSSRIIHEDESEEEKTAGNKSDSQESDSEGKSSSKDSSESTTSSSSSDSEESSEEETKRPAKRARVVRKNRNTTKKALQYSDEETPSSSEEAKSKKQQPLTARRRGKRTTSSEDTTKRRTALGLRTQKKNVTYDEYDMEEEEEEEEEEAPRKRKTSQAKPTKKKAKRKSKKRRESDESSEEEEEEEDQPVNMEIEEEEKSVDKIISQRPSAKITDELEFLVKWKNKSFLHASWVQRHELESEKFSKQKLQTFLKKNPIVFNEDEPFDPDFTQVDRVLAICKPSTPNGITKYFIKWKSLPYEECTWENADRINDDEQLALFATRNRLPSTNAKPLPRDPEGWKQLADSPEYKGGNQLRSYQMEADEMGLGKTVQSVVMIDYLVKEKKIRGPFLVVAPLSTIPHWKREFEAWTDLNVVVYHGTAKSRGIIKQYEFRYLDDKGNIINKQAYKFQVLITTYEMIITDFSVLKPVHWKYLVVDEAHRLKNKASKLGENLKQFTFDSILLLTGTPIQNNMEELWTLLNVVDPEKFKSLSKFLAEYGDVKDSDQVSKLHSILKPYLLRRMKEHVEKSIAPKEETIIEVELTTLQKKYYRAIYEKNFTFLSKGSKSGNVPSLLNVMMELRKCCNHPYLIKGVEEDVTSGLKTPEQAFQSLVQCSGKLVLIDKLLPKLRDGNHKVLIFSQMVRVLDLLEDYLNYKRYLFERLDGGIKGSERQAAIDRFSKPDSDRFIFLLSTRAGGLGINLTAADTVIIFDSDWNPQNDIQAQARCHRIGQKQLVKVYRLVTKNSYEWQMFDRSSKKLGLDQAVLSNINNEFSEKSQKQPVLDKQAIDALLKYGAYDLLSKDDDEASRRFCEEDIDKILERATTVVHKTEEVGLSSFSKASFASSTAAPELDLNDPDFWKKLLPNAANAPDPLIQAQPRERKKVQRFGAEELDDSDESQEEAESSEFELTDETEKKWAESERGRFKKALMQYGYGRWQDIQDKARLSRWSLQEIEHYGKAFLAKVIAHRKEAGDKVIETVLNVDSKDSTTGATKLEESSPIVNVVDTPQDTTPTDSMQSVSAEKVDLATPVPQEDQPQDIKLEQSDLADITFDSKADEYFIRNAKQLLKRLQNVAFLGKIVRAYDDPLHSLPVPTIEDQPPDADWSPQDDRSLMVGSYRHGVGNYDSMRNDPELSFLKKYQQAASTPTAPEVLPKLEEQEPPHPQADQQTATTQQSQIQTEPPVVAEVPPVVVETVAAPSPTTTTATTSRTWPAAKLLNERLKKLIRFFTREKKQQERAEKQKEKEKKEEEKLKRREELHSEWSKRERQDFYKTLTSFGVPLTDKGELNWQAIKDKANLKRKNLEQIESYYIEFIKQCRNRLEEKETNTELNTTKADDLSKPKCKKVVERCALFADIRTQVLQFENLEKKLKSVRKTSNLPKWWVAGVHDKPLLQGVAKHGLDFEEICSDPDLPFLTIYNDIIAKTRHHHKDQQQPETTTTSAPQDPASLIPPNDKMDVDKENTTQSLPATISTSSVDVSTSSATSAVVPQALTNEAEKPTSEEIEAPHNESDEKADEKLKENKEGDSTEATKEGKSKKKKKSKPSTGTEDQTPKEDKEEEEESDAETKTAKRKRKEKEKLEVMEFPKEKVMVKRIQALVETIKAKIAKDKEKPPKSDTVTTDEQQPNGEPPKKKKKHKKKEDENDDTKKDKTDGQTTEGKPVKKRKKADNKVTKKLMQLPLDANNNVKFPIVLSGSLSVHRLGTVVFDNPAFHSSNYVWPVGYKSVRLFTSMKQPDHRISYVNEILASDSQPVFRVTPEDDPENPISASSATAAWKTIIEKVNALKTDQSGKRMFSAVSGPEYFGFSNPTISKLIQELPNVDKCTSYIKKEFTNGVTAPKSNTTTTSTTTATTVSHSIPEPTKAAVELNGDSAPSSSRVMSISNLTSSENAADFTSFIPATNKLAPAPTVSSVVNGRDAKPTKYGTIDVYFSKGPTMNIPMLHSMQPLPLPVTPGAHPLLVHASPAREMPRLPPPNLPIPQPSQPLNTPFVHTTTPKDKM